jgi:hypothetical protein
MKNIEYIKKNFPSIANSMSADQLISYSADISAQARGAGSREDIAYETQITNRNKQLLEMAKTDPGVMTAKADFLKAQKAKSPIEEEEALARLNRAMAILEAQIPKPTRLNSGLGALPKGSDQPGAKPAPGAEKPKYRMTKDGKLVETSNP